MEIYVKGEKIVLPNKECGKGSEGKAYLYNDKIYKIYYTNAINEGYGNKENFHRYLLALQTDQIYLPIDIILDENGEYIGYVTEYAHGNKKDKKGITKMSRDNLINNLITLEKSFNYLSDNYVLTNDVSVHNTIIDYENNEINIIDPGRYRCYNLLTQNDYRIQNKKRLEYLIELLIYMDFISYKPAGSKRLEKALCDYIKSDKLKLGIDNYSDYFKYRLEDYENVLEYAKTLKKYVK